MMVVDASEILPNADIFRIFELQIPYENAT